MYLNCTTGKKSNTFLDNITSVVRVGNVSNKWDKKHAYHNVLFREPQVIAQNITIVSVAVYTSK